MRYISTRGAQEVSACQAVVNGIAPDGGLYVPESFPELGDPARFCAMSYPDAARDILAMYFDQFNNAELESITASAYGVNFDAPQTAPVKKLAGSESIMELFHGPTIAFKDMALQIMPYLMTLSLQKTAEKNKVLILVATSGDTGKAALEGYADVPGTAIAVFYPADGVSSAQKRQMITQKGENVYVCSVRGNFDDAQTGVKKIFTDPELGKLLAEKGYRLSSANSINWGRLAPQIVYYVWSYAQLIKSGEVKAGEKFNIVVPTGNFGNILAAYYAIKMGLPVNRLICASNSNNVLTDFFKKGVYDRRREFYKTMSPSMDILISSNLERLVFDALDCDAAKTAELMSQLSKDGCYTLPESARAKLDGLFYAGYCPEEQCEAAIKEVFDKYGYLMDTHTAVAQHVYDEYVKETGDETPAVIVSTASPFKFAPAVLKALGKETGGDEFELADRLEAASGVAVPEAIESLRNAKVRFEGICEKDGMQDALLKAVADWEAK